MYSETQTISQLRYSDSLNIRIRSILLNLGVSIVCVGYDYLIIAISETYKDPSVAEYVTKTMIPHVAKMCGDRKCAAIHRAMLRAVDYIREYPDSDMMRKYLGSASAPVELKSLVIKIATYLRREDALE